METAETTQPPVATPNAATSVLVETAPHLRWGAIFGGAVAALGVGAMLYALGLALGLSVVDARDPASLRPSGIFAGVWAIVVSLVALFAGGFVAARGAGAVTRGLGALHGLVMWGLTVVAGVWLLGNIAATLVSSAAVVGAEATESVTAPGRAPTAEQLERRAQQAERRAEESLSGMRAEARRAVDQGETAFWGLFGALFLGMLAAIGGAIVGGRSGGRSRTKRLEVTERDRPPVVRREAYP